MSVAATRSHARASGSRSGEQYSRRRASFGSALGGRHNAFVTDTYGLIRAATLARRQVVATYKGHRRELCPHVLGTKEGRRQALFFQFRGGAHQRYRPAASGAAFPWMGSRMLSFRAGPWHTDVGHQYPETCADRIDVEAPRE
jgi:hypothetical protein